MKSHGALALALAAIPPSDDIVDDQAMDDEVHPVDNSTFLDWLDVKVNWQRMLTTMTLWIVQTRQMITLKLMLKVSSNIWDHQMALTRNALKVSAMPMPMLCMIHPRTQGLHQML